jgi:hypothetical protein
MLVLTGGLSVYQSPKKIQRYINIYSFLSHFRTEKTLFYLNFRKYRIVMEK